MPLPMPANALSSRVASAGGPSIGRGVRPTLESGTPSSRVGYPKIDVQRLVKNDFRLAKMPWACSLVRPILSWKSFICCWSLPRSRFEALHLDQHLHQLIDLRVGQGDLEFRRDAHDDLADGGGIFQTLLHDLQLDLFHQLGDRIGVAHLLANVGGVDQLLRGDFFGRFGYRLGPWPPRTL